MPNPFYQAVGSKIRAARERACLSQDELADKAGTNGAFLGRVERGLQNMSLMTIGRLAVALGVAPSLFFEGVVPQPDVGERPRRRNARAARKPTDGE